SASAAIATALLIVLTAACGRGTADTGIEAASVVAMHRADAARTGRYQTEGPVEYQSIKWQFEADDWVFGAPAVVGDSVYFAGYDGDAYAVDRETGAEKWRFESGDVIIAAPAADDTHVFVANMSGLIVALNSATGEKRWEVDAGTGFSGSPAVVADLVYFAGENGLLLALDKHTGEEKWRFQQPNAAIPFSPAV